MKANLENFRPKAQLLGAIGILSSFCYYFNSITL
jgi:hypothetical protein